MRAAAFLVWVLAALVVLWPLWRRRPLPPPRPEIPPRDELVKDPVCQTYVVRSRAVSRADAGVARYFCSAECARRYAVGS
jgi:YHS domain-containing protein